MSAMEEHIDLFEAFTLGQISGPEKEAFLQRLKTDQAFKVAFEQYQHQLKVIKAMSAGEEMRALMEAEEAEENPAKTRWRYWVPLAAVAALILSFFVFGPDKQPTGPALFDEYFEVFPNLISARDNTADISEALRAYGRGDFEKAIQSFQQLPTQNDTVIFYKSISHLSLAEPDEALMGLMSISGESSFYESAIWYQGLAHLLLNQKDSVSHYMNRIDANNAYSKTAQKVLKALN